MSIKLYVTLLKQQDTQVEYKKLIVMIETNTRVSMLKRRIEQEFTELFPAEKPFICSKLEDQYGYSLSNSSLVGDLLKYDDRITAVPEDQGRGFIASTDPRELVSMLSTVQENISNKLSESALASYNPIKELLFSILPLCFIQNPSTLHSACVSLSKSLHEGNYNIIDAPEHSDLFALLLTTVNYLTHEYIEQDTVVQRALIDVLEVLIHSKKFITAFKSSSTVQRLVSSSRSLNQNNKARMIKIISSINRGEETWEEPAIENPQKKYSSYSGRSREPRREELGENYRENPREIREPRTHTGDNGMSGMVSDFIMMISPQNTIEMIGFALHSLENFVTEAIDVAMQSPELFFRCFSLIEISTPVNFHSVQINLLRTLGAKLTLARAEDAVSKSGLTRLLKAYSSCPESFQPAILSLFEQVLKFGRKVIDVPALISICLCPYPVLNSLAMSALAALADPSDRTANDTQFENHVRFFLTACTNDKQSNEYRNAAASAIASLSLREYLRPQIIYCGGIETFIFMLKDSGRVESQRMAAKALVNLTATKRDLKMKVVSELADEIKKLYRNELDSIVSAYLQTLVSGR